MHFVLANHLQTPFSISKSPSLVIRFPFALTSMQKVIRLGEVPLQFLNVFLFLECNHGSFLDGNTSREIGNKNIVIKGIDAR